MFTVFWNLIKRFYIEYTTILMAYAFHDFLIKIYRSKTPPRI